MISTLIGKLVRGATGATFLAFLPLAASAQGPAPVSNVPISVQELVRDSYIFVFDDSVSSGAVQSQARALVQGAGGSLRHVYSTAIRGFAAQMPAAAAARLAAANPNIAYYHADAVVFAVDPPPHNHGGGGGDDGDSGLCEAEVIPPGIARVGGPVDASDAFLFPNAVWVIDTGVDYEHADLNVDMTLSTSFAGGSGDDKNGHGTHVAGTAAAIDNDCQVVGVAAGARVVGVKVLKPSGSGSLADVIAGVDYAAANFLAGDVANMSLGANDPNHALQALDDAVVGAANTGSGLLFSLAAGNSGANVSTFTPARTGWHAKIYTVSAVDDNDDWASFSNYGDEVDFAAPGVNVLSLRAGGETTAKSGTSMSAPHVAGILLVDGRVCSNGSAFNDPDGPPNDPIAHLC